MSIRMSNVAASAAGFLVVMVIAGCTQPRPSPSQPTPNVSTTFEPLRAGSTKGYELYAWQDGRNWRYALLEGTNRNKEDAEIAAPKSRLESLDDVMRALKPIRPKESVTLMPRHRGGPIPPKEALKELRSFCERRQLHLQGLGQ